MLNILSFRRDFSEQLREVEGKMAERDVEKKKWSERAESMADRARIAEAKVRRGIFVQYNT